MTNDNGDVSFETDIEDFQPVVENYTPTNNFMRRRKNALEGIFTGEVIAACFDGEALEGRNGCVCMVGEAHECYFGLILDPDDGCVVDGNVLQVNPVQASMSGHWPSGVITRMQALAKKHEGGVWNSHKDPHVGNKQRWVPEHDTPGDY